MNIVAIAHLALCETCQMHGCIVFADGGVSQVFASVEEAVEQVRASLAGAKITAPEAEYLRAEIGKSKLVLQSRVDPEIFPFFRKVLLESHGRANNYLYTTMFPSFDNLKPPDEGQFH